MKKTLAVSKYYEDLANSIDSFRNQKNTDEDWDRVSRYVMRNVNKYYKRIELTKKSIKYNERRYTDHTNRVLWFLQFCNENSHKTPRWCIATWRIRTAWVELLLECSKHGVSLYSDKLTLTQKINKVETRKICRVKDIVRKNEFDSTDFTKIKEKLSEKFTNSVASSHLDAYKNFIWSRHPEFFEPRETRNAPRRCKRLDPSGSVFS